MCIGLDVSLNNGRNTQTFTFALSQTHMHLITHRVTDTHLALSGGVMLAESSRGCLTVRSEANPGGNPERAHRLWAKDFLL